MDENYPSLKYGKMGNVFPKILYLLTHSSYNCDQVPFTQQNISSADYATFA
jgi:hypothetical protein